MKGLKNRNLRKIGTRPSRKCFNASRKAVVWEDVLKTCFVEGSLPKLYRRYVFESRHTHSISGQLVEFALKLTFEDMEAHSKRISFSKGCVYITHNFSKTTNWWVEAVLKIHYSGNLCDHDYII